MQAIELTGWEQQGGQAFAPAVEEESRSSLSVRAARHHLAGGLGGAAHLPGRVVGERRCAWAAAWVGSFRDMPRVARLQGWDFQGAIVTLGTPLETPLEKGWRG